MPALIQAPSKEAVALARALISEPHETPASKNRVLSAAAAAVAAELDEYDLRLFVQVADEPMSSRKREVLEQAIAQRIERARLLGS